MRFILLNRKNKLIILTSIRYIAKDIRKNRIYIALSISICKTESLYINTSKM